MSPDLAAARAAARAAALAAAIEERLGLMGVFGYPTPEQFAEAERCARRTESREWLEELRLATRPKLEAPTPTGSGVQRKMFG